jgi:diadenosine tetraphosphatase ApaH/serine/threonine PP2A family protein phosphatase
MITRMFGRPRPQQQPHAVAPEVPPGSRVYAVGDIHGRVDLLRALHRLIQEDAVRRQAARNVVVYLGDYIDRGGESPAVIDLLLDQPLRGFERVHLKGNHEDSLLRFLDDASIGVAWLLYGGAQTLQSYGVAPPRAIGASEDMVRAQSELKQKLPKRHRQFMAGLELIHAEGDYLFAHAGVRPGVPLDQQLEQDLLWIRDEFLLSDAEFGKIVVHGHTITLRPDVQPNRIGIDTGAFASGTLTCLVLEGTDVAFLQT